MKPIKPIKTLDEITTEKAQIVQDLSNAIDDFIVTQQARFDEALVAVLVLFVHKLKIELSEEKFEELVSMPLREVLNTIMSDSILLSYRKQTRETN